MLATRARAARPARLTSAAVSPRDRGSAAAARPARGPPRPAPSPRTAMRSAWPSGASARRRRLQQALEAAEVAQARLHLEQHRVRPRRPARTPAASETLRRERQRGMRHRQHGPASRAGSAWPRTMRGASASAVARFSPGLTPCARAAALAAEMRCSSTRAIVAGSALDSPTSPTRVAANDSSESKGRCSAIQSTANQTGSIEHGRRDSRRSGERTGRSAQAKLTKVAAWQRPALRSLRPSAAARRSRAPPASASCSGASERRAAPLQDAHAAAGRRLPACSDRRNGDAVGRAAAARLAQDEGGTVVADGRRAGGGAAARRAARGGSQATTAPTWPLFSACSSAHRLSLPGTTRAARVDDEQLLDVEAERRRAPSPRASAGGSKTITSRPARCAATSAGASRRISPTPACGSSSSLRTRRGQPPPGSSASSAAKPLATVRGGAAARAGDRARAPDAGFRGARRRSSRVPLAASPAARTPERMEPAAERAAAPEARRNGSGHERPFDDCTFIQ